MCPEAGSGRLTPSSSTSPSTTATTTTSSSDAVQVAVRQRVVDLELSSDEAKEETEKTPTTRGLYLRQKGATMMATATMATVGGSR
jgi:hypothetical protein